MTYYTKEQTNKYSLTKNLLKIKQTTEVVCGQAGPMIKWLTKIGARTVTLKLSINAKKI